jgi:hypothetical protein
MPGENRNEWLDGLAQLGGGPSAEAAERHPGQVSETDLHSVEPTGRGRGELGSAKGFRDAASAPVVVPEAIPSCVATVRQGKGVQSPIAVACPRPRFSGTADALRTTPGQWISSGTLTPARSQKRHTSLLSSALGCWLEFANRPAVALGVMYRHGIGYLTFGRNKGQLWSACRIIGPLAVLDM